MSKQPAIWAALRLFGPLCGAVPHARAVALGGAIGRLVMRHSGGRAARTSARVERFLGVPAAKAEAITRGVYENFGRGAVELLRLPKMARRLGELVAVRGGENLSAAVAQGHGVIFLSAHIGNWEYGAAALAQRGYPMNAIGAEARDPRITAESVRLRLAAGVRTVGKGRGLRAAVECLRNKEILAVMLDQDAREAGIVSPFLGHPASTPTGPLKLARKFGSLIVPAHIVRNPDGVTMTLHIEPPLPACGDEQDAVDRCNAVLSRWIRANPDQWMWTYPRWATTLGDR